MIRSVLFLDFDGVLNSVFSRRGGRSDADHIDPAMVERVNRIVERTGCAVVVSSSWRILYGPEPIPRLQVILAERGARFELTGATPRMAPHDETCHGQGHADECGRGHEIQAWLVDSGWDGPIAILDDGSDMGHLLPRLVQTKDDVGIEDDHVERVCALLGETKTETA